MSNTIRFNALLLRALAAELDARLRGVRVARAHFVRGLRAVVLELGQRRQPLTLSWSLLPTAGHVLLTEGRSHGTGALLQVLPGTPIAAVRALPNERVAVLELAPGNAAAGVVRKLVVELVGNRWNAVALGADDVIGAVLLARPADARALRAGVPYSPPAARPRLGAENPLELSRWQAILGPVPPETRRRALLDSVAYTSPLNADWILGDAQLPEAGGHVLEEAYRRYLRLVQSPPQPVLRNGGQPYPQACAESDVLMPSLLAAFAAAAEQAGAPPVAGAAALRELLRARIHDRQQRVSARLEKLEAEARDALAEAARLRREADVLMAQLHAVPRGATEVELSDFAGGRLSLRLDLALTPLRNAQQWYEQARRRERAAQRAPGLLERAREEGQRLAALRARVEAGTWSTGELPEWLRRPEAPVRATPLPYRKYRSSGGLEVRVGRNARANDVLTRQYAAPDDIWLHARDAGGAHVVLRWGRREENPPRQDLVEAAVLAALHSRARTSAVVPVDWTRRKYVRKPRGAAPGQVVVERARTLFVAPDSALAQRLHEAGVEPT